MTESDPMHVTNGGCHCGNIRIAYRSGTAPGETLVRACQCLFCRKHGARAVSDPAGRAEIEVRQADDLRRYRFGLGTADFFVCGQCGVYVGAVMVEAGGVWSTLIVNAFDEPERFTQAAAPVEYDDEDEAARRQRRRQNWTPTEVRIAPG